jgi:Xaa-Pro dipeptidase
MPQGDSARVERLQRLMKKAGMDALVCRLPENVVFLTDYWPHHGFSFVVVQQEGLPYLYVPEFEEDYTDPKWAHVGTFGWGLLTDDDLYVNYRTLLGQLNQKLGLKGATIGVEKSFEVVGPTYRSAEPVIPAAPWTALMDEVFAGAKQVDGGDVLQQARSVKSEYDLKKIRIADEIAEMGINELMSNLEPGMSEVQIGALIEHKIRSDGPGYKGARLVRASCEVGAGAAGSFKGTVLIPSTTYIVKEGDLVMIELATVADGYWSDLTYMAVVGKPSERQREVYNHVLEAQQAAARQMRPGALFSAPDAAAREVLKKAGLGDYFVHITGHGVGFRYHEFIPFLAPAAGGTLEAGMVSSVEPGVYIPNFGGIRIEDNVAVGSDGPVFLSTPRKPW